jgi:hypothetical protein
MANHSKPIKWERGSHSETNPMHKSFADSYFATFQVNDLPGLTTVANGDWLTTEPIPQDICSDFILTCRRMAGTVDLPLEIEGSHDPFMKNKTGSAAGEDWESMTGQDLVWNISGTANPTPWFDWVKFDLAEIGVMPYIRLAYKNSTGSATSPIHQVTLSFERGT